MFLIPKMAYGRRYRKRTGRNYRRRFKRKSAKKMMLKPTMYGKLRQPIHYFVRHVDLGAIATTINQAFTTGVLTFKLADIPNYTEFVAIYDSFIIKAVKVEFIPMSNTSEGVYSSGGSPYVTNNSPFNYDYRIATAIDYQDNTVPGSLNAIREYRSCKVSPNLRIHKRFLHPRSLNTIDEDGSTGGNYNFGINSKWCWINTGANQTQFMSVKYGFEHHNQANSYSAYRVECKYYLCFKGPN